MQRKISLIVSLIALVMLGMAAQIALSQTPANKTSSLEAQATTQAQQLATTEAELHTAWEYQARSLADQSRRELEAGSPHSALLLALESFAHYPEIYVAESGTALSDVLAHPAREIAYLPHDDWVDGAVWSADEKRILSWANDYYDPNSHFVRVWDIESGRELLALRHQNQVNGAAWNNDESRILSWSGDYDSPGRVQVWDAYSGELLLTLPYDSSVGDASWNRDESRILASDRNGSQVWDAKSGELLFALRGTMAAWNAAETRIITQSEDTVWIWDAQTGDELFELKHENEVTTAQWNEDGTQLLTTSGNLIRVWDAESGTRLLVLRHLYPVTNAIWNKDETQILAWGDDDNFPNYKGMVQVWDSTSGDQLLVIEQDGAIWDVSWSPDETRLLRNNGREITVWDTANGDYLFRLDHDIDYEDYVGGGAWSPDGSYIMSWTVKGIDSFSDAVIYIWSAERGYLLFKLRYPPVTFLEASWNKEGTQILSWTGGIVGNGMIGDVYVWDVDGSDVIPSLEHENSGSQYNVSSNVSWNPDESKILSWFGDLYWRNYIRVWDAQNFQEIFTIPTEGTVLDANWNADGTGVLLWQNEDSARMLDAESGELLFTLPQSQDSYSPRWNAGKTRVFAWGDGELHVWDAENGHVVSTFPYQYNLNDAVWSADGVHILGLDSNYDSKQSVLHVWDSNNGDETLNVSIEGYANHVMWSNRESKIIAYGNEKIWIVDAATGDLLSTFDPEEIGIRGAALSPDETRLLSWGNMLSTESENILRVWDVQSGENIFTRRFPPTGYGLINAQWNKDGTKIMSSLDDGVVRVWDAETGEELLTLRHVISEYGVGAAWNSDETRIISWTRSYEDVESVYIWDANTGKLLLQLNPGYTIAGLNWNESETRLITWSVYGHIRLWITDIDELLALGRGQVIREFSNEERERFFLPTLVPTLTPSPTAPN